jgi:putative transposase
LHGEHDWLEYQELEKSCRKEDVLVYLDALAKQAEKEELLTVVVLDNASFHRAEQVQEKRSEWEAKGLYLRYLPAYCPHLNLIETIWRRLKSFLMPRRYYHTLAELKDALLVALKVLGAVRLQT